MGRRHRTGIAFVSDSETKGRGVRWRPPVIDLAARLAHCLERQVREASRPDAT